MFFQMIVQIYCKKKYIYMFEYIIFCKLLANECQNIIWSYKILWTLGTTNVFVHYVFGHPQSLIFWRVKLLFNKFFKSAPCKEYYLFTNKYPNILKGIIYSQINKQTILTVNKINQVLCQVNIFVHEHLNLFKYPNTCYTPFYTGSLLGFQNNYKRN